MIGYDKFYLNWQLYLALTFEEMTGILACDRSKRRINCTLHGPPTWASLANGLPYLDFDPATDWVDAPAAHNELDFQAEDFSMVAWVNVDDLSVNRQVLVRGVADTDGWFFFIDTTGRVALATCQTVPAATQASYSFTDIATGNWYLIGATRSGANVHLYVNGDERTDAPDTHIDPLTSARELHIGIQDDETTEPFDGKMWYPRIWGSRCLTDEEMSRIFEHERNLLGV